MIQAAAADGKATREEPNRDTSWRDELSRRNRGRFVARGALPIAPGFRLRRRPV